MLLAFLALAGSVCAAAADTLIGSIFNADTFPAVSSAAGTPPHLPCCHVSTLAHMLMASLREH